jgi:PKD repeat protein
MKKTGLLLMILMAWAGAINSQSVTTMAVAAAQDFFKGRPEYLNLSASSEIKVCRFWLTEGDTAILMLAPKDANGFVLVSAERSGPRILAFSSSGRIGEQELPPGFLWLVEAYRMSLQEEIISDQNCDFLKGKISALSNTAFSQQSVFPLLYTTWDQRCLYNDSCPTDAASPAYFCGKAPAGCVATTLAQILKYHKWPLQGTGTKSYYSPKYGTLSANFGATSYQIAFLPNAIYSAHSGVARLLYHAGIASQMNYGPLGSGTSITDARNALVSYFGYKNSAQVVAKSSYTDVDWKNLMRGEIDAGRPVFYSGVEQTGGGGHAWVLDGYSGSDYFHFNWGWSGVADGYFTLANLNPLGGANYVNYQEAIIGIEPTGGNPLASFTADKQVTDKGGPVTFTNLSTGNPTVYQWIFQGGSPSSFAGANPPAVTYSSSGEYEVILIAGNGTWTDTLRRKGYIRVLPIISFIASETITETGGKIDFFDKSESTVPMQTWQWYFFGGNPTQSALQNPTGIQYSQPGQYAVMLKSSNSLYSDSRMALKFITVHQQCDTLLDFFMPGYTVQAVNQPVFQIYQEDLDGLTPYHSTYITSGWQYYTENGGNQFVSATSLFASPGTANNWLVFGPVTLPQGGAQLSWRHKFPDNTKRDGYEILVSTTGHTHTQFTGMPIFALSDNDPYTLGDTTWRWNSAAIPSSYGGQPCWIAVHHYAVNMFYLAFDDFRITSCDGFPLAADLFSFDTLISAGDTALFYNFSSGDPSQVSWNFPGGILLNPGEGIPKVAYPNPGTFDAAISATYGSGQNTKNRPGYIQVKPAGFNMTGHEASNVSLFPNPASDYMYIRGVPDGCFYRITDIRGVIAASGSFDRSGKLDISLLSPGVWFLNVSVGQVPLGTFRLLKI